MRYILATTLLLSALGCGNDIEEFCTRAVECRTELRIPPTFTQASCEAILENNEETDGGQALNDAVFACRENNEESCLNLANCYCTEVNAFGAFDTSGICR